MSPSVTSPKNAMVFNHFRIHGVRQEIPDRRISSLADRISDLNFKTEVISRFLRGPFFS
jgi:hypothetical protein